MCGWVVGGDAMLGVSSNMDRSMIKGGGVDGVEHFGGVWCGDKLSVKKSKWFQLF